MSRDALLIILAIVVIANFVFLAEVAVLNRRRSQRERSDARSDAAAATGVAVIAPVTVGAEPPGPIGPRLVRPATTDALPDAAEPARAPAAAAATTEPETRAVPP